MDFDTWLDTFVDEKALDLWHFFEVQGPEWGLNLIPLAVVIDLLKGVKPANQVKAKDILVRMDFVNADVMAFFELLAQEVAL